MSRDITVRKTQVDPLSMAFPFMYINPSFGYSVSSITRYIDSSPDSVIKENSFPYDIKEYFWTQEGVPGKQPWYALGYLNQDIYFFYKAFTYTSFDKDGHMDLWVSHQFSDLIQYAMDTLTYNIYILSTQNKISDESTSDPLVNQ